jgi:hypothetical protein
VPAAGPRSWTACCSTTAPTPKAWPARAHGGPWSTGENGPATCSASRRPASRSTSPVWLDTGRPCATSTRPPTRHGRTTFQKSSRAHREPPASCGPDAALRCFAQFERPGVRIRRAPPSSQGRQPDAKPVRGHYGYAARVGVDVSCRCRRSLAGGGPGLLISHPDPCGSSHGLCVTVGLDRAARDQSEDPLQVPSQPGLRADPTTRNPPQGPAPDGVAPVPRMRS